jgi:hypothetical protein
MGGNGMPSVIEEVESIFSKYWGGHYEVVTTFFSRPRPREELLAWLDLQLYKEIHVVPAKAQALIDMYSDLDATIERGEYEAEAYEMADEIQHYRLLADVREMITGARIKAVEPRPTSEQIELEETRRRYAHKAPAVKAVGGFSPGGGVAFAAAGAMIEGGPIERQLAQVFKTIYQQELVHYHQRRAIFERLAREAEAAVQQEILSYAGALARQHFIMRNAAFHHPLSPERVAEIDQGRVPPYLPPRLY